MTIIKKILIAVFLPLATFSQTRFKVTECHSDIKLDSEWIRFQQFYPTQMTAIADGNIFSIDNEYHSIFKIYGDTTMLIKPDFTLYGWDALDKLDSPCAVIFVKFNNDRCLYSFTAFYDKISYYYSLSLIE